MPEFIELEITALGAQGDGIGQHKGTPVFVPSTVPGDKVRVQVIEQRKNGIHAALDAVLTESPDRVEPPCRHFEACGGCQLQFLSKESYGSWIKERVTMALSHHGFDASLVEPPLISPLASRRRVALKALMVPGRLLLGFSERQSHKLVDLSECPITRREITELLPEIRRVLKQILKLRMQAEVHLTVTAMGLDMLVDAPMELDLNARELLVSFAEKNDIAALHWRDQGFLDPVVIRREPVMRFSGVPVVLSPASFVQATAEGETALIAEVVKGCSGLSRVADLFCGMGTFTLPLAKEHQVLAVEGAKKPLDALRQATNQATDLKQIVTKHRDLFRRPLTANELKGFNAVVFDPPRAGAKEQALELAMSEVRRVVAVSCNPNTFSRDARTLVDGGYVLEKVVPVDQFLWSSHVELVGIFTRP